MEISKLVPSDSVFISLFEEYCLNSKPLPQMHEGSLSKRLLSIEDYRKELFLICDFSLIAKDDQGQPILYSFFCLSEDKSFLIMNFIVPNVRLTSTRSITNITKYKTAFCESFLFAYEETGLDLVKSDINRIYKRESLIKTLVRFLPPFTLVKNQKGEICSVEVEKKNVISFYEKVKSKNNRDKPNNQAS